MGKGSIHRQQKDHTSEAPPEVEWTFDISYQIYFPPTSVDQETSTTIQMNGEKCRAPAYDESELPDEFVEQIEEFVLSQAKLHFEEEEQPEFIVPCEFVEDSVSWSATRPDPEPEDYYTEDSTEE